MGIEETEAVAVVDPMKLALEEAKFKGISADAGGADSKESRGTDTDDSTDESEETDTEESGDEDTPLTAHASSASRLIPGTRATVSNLESAGAMKYIGTVCSLTSSSTGKWQVVMHD